MASARDSLVARDGDVPRGPGRRPGAPQSGASGRFLSGFSHPISGWGHILAMIAVGLAEGEAGLFNSLRRESGVGRGPLLSFCGSPRGGRPEPVAQGGRVGLRRIGAFQGYLTGSAFAAAPSGNLELLGSVAALALVITIGAGFVVSLKVFWARIAVRVVGSWIAATGLLMLGWALRGAR